jgi:hypothetical protein
MSNATEAQLPDARPLSADTCSAPYGHSHAAAERVGTVEEDRKSDAIDWGARFWRHVHPEALSGCWLWHGAVTGRGDYGRTILGARKGRTRPAHRVAYELTRGPIPEGMCVCHACDVPLCVNPEHLFLGTQADNVADMVAKGRVAKGIRNGSHTMPWARGGAKGDANASRKYPERRPRGEMHASAKLTADSVRAIRARLVLGERPSALAREYGVTQPCIRFIELRRTWGSV